MYTLFLHNEYRIFYKYLNDRIRNGYLLDEIQFLYRFTDSAYVFQAQLQKIKSGVAAKSDAKKSWVTNLEVKFFSFLFPYFYLIPS